MVLVIRGKCDLIKYKRKHHVPMCDTSIMKTTRKYRKWELGQKVDHTVKISAPTSPTLYKSEFEFKTMRKRHINCNKLLLYLQTKVISK